MATPSTPTFCPNCGKQHTLKTNDLQTINDGEWQIGVDYGDGSLEYYTEATGYECTACNYLAIIEPINNPRKP